MDKFRRARKPTTPSQQILPATSSSAAAGAPSTSATKFTIQQRVPTGTIKKGPYSVKRSVDPNDILIKRRPDSSVNMDHQHSICRRSINFQMDVCNQPNCEDSIERSDGSFQMVVQSQMWLKTATGLQSTIQQTFINQQKNHNNQQEHYQFINQQEPYYLSNQQQTYENYEATVVHNRSPSHATSEGSKPLFSREDICVNRSVSPKKKPISRASSSDFSSPEDRNRHRRNSSKSKQTTTRKKSPEKVPYFLDQARENDRIKRVYGPRRSRSLSPDRNRRRPNKTRSRSRTSPTYHRRKSYERRSPNRDRHRARYRSNHSRSRSLSRERRRMPLSRRTEDDRQSMSLQAALPPPVTQYIPIPVPVEYPYMQPSWGGPMLPPQPRFPYPMRPALPPPMPYMLRPHRPPRYLQNAYQRGHFRPRQY